MVELKETLLRYLETLTSGGAKINEICEQLGLSSDEKDVVLEALRELELEGKVWVSKHKSYSLLAKTNRAVGVLSIKRHGVGVLLGDEKYKLSADNLNGAISGDKVIISNGGSGKEYHVERILERGSGLITCGVMEDDGVKIAVPLSDDEFLRVDIPDEELSDYKDGDMIVVEIEPSGENEVYKRTPKKKKKKGINYAPTHNGKVIRYVGNLNDPGADAELIANKHGFYKTYPKEVEEETKHIPEDISGEDISDRRDYRNKIIFTIDGDDTKDIDDAISLEILPNGNYKLGVHIADVSHYVKPGMALFKEAKRRGTSLYFLDKVVAMLPKKLSNGICSLNEDEDRLTKTCEMEITPDGRIVKSEIFRSVIRSRKQMTYDAVNKIIENGEVPEGYEAYKDILVEMHELSKALERRRVAEGKIDFYSVEPKIKTNADGTVKSAKPRYQKSAENLIENFMVAANYSVAEKFKELPFIFRVHEFGNIFRLKYVFSILQKIIKGMKVPNKIYNQDIQELLSNIKDTNLYGPVSRLILRCMKKAIYSEKNTGHKGLGLKIYTHFTSPIRRFSDLVVHTLIDIYLDKEFEKKKNDPEYMEDLKEKVAACAAQATAREGEADQAEKDINTMKLAEYMGSNIGEEKTGTIMEICSKGVYVTFDEIYEGFVPNNCIEGEGKLKVAKDKLSFSKGEDEYSIGETVAVNILGTSKKEGIKLGLKGHTVIKLYEAKDKIKSLT